jgi:Flp pilus assembly protein TadD
MSEDQSRSTARRTLATGREVRRDRITARLSAIGAAGICVAAAAYLWIGHEDQHSLQEARDLAGRGEVAAALEKSREIDRSPADLEALELEASLLAALGRTEQAVDAFAHAVERDPNNWALRSNLAVVLMRSGRRGDARREMGRALALNPRMRLPAGFVLRGASGRR